MANHDPISDMLTRIRNASEKRHQSTKVPASRMARSIAKVLQQEGFIAEITEDYNFAIGLAIINGRRSRLVCRKVERKCFPCSGYCCCGNSFY